jgi:hypothetical protein
MNSKRKEEKFIHIRPVEQILISKNNQLLVTRSCDSVFVWDISQRVAVDPVTQPAQEMDLLSPASNPQDRLTERSQLKSYRSTKISKEFDDIVLFRKERESPYCPTISYKKSELSYKPSDVIPFKEAILYYSTLLKRSKPKLEVTYKCSYGLDTRY